MSFCPKCGTNVGDTAKFCHKCGQPIVRAAVMQTQNVTATQVSNTPNNAAFAVPQYAAQPVQQVTQPAVRAPQSVAPAAGVYDFSAVTVRYRCPNGHVFDGNERETLCRTCGAPLPKGGYIQLYRMGNYMGCAVGMGVYIDDAPCGHIANRQSIRISVPFGPHKIHVTHTTTRKCNDPIFTVTPSAPYVWCKAHFSKAGFAITVEPASPDTMPKA